MGIFDNCLLASDVDGTILADKFVNPENIKKIEFFMNEGGHFSLSTGRSVTAVGMVLSKLKKVSPSVVANGCMIYDYENSKSLHEEYIPLEDYEIVKKVSELDMNIGIEIHTGERVFTLKRTKVTDNHQIYENLETTEITFEEVSKLNWNKAFYALETEDDRIKLNSFLKSFNCGSDFMNTIAFVDGETKYYCEQVPRGVSKASTILKLAEILNIEKGKIFAIGDYFNDIEMLKTADISAAVAGSPDEVAQYADYITKRSCEDGAVADFIDYLTNKFSAK